MHSPNTITRHRLKNDFYETTPKFIYTNDVDQKEKNPEINKTKQ